MTQLKLIVVVWIIVVLAVASIAAKEKPSKSEPSLSARRTEASRAAHEDTEPSSSLASMRLREGARITDELGEFQMTADRFNFTLQNDKRVIRVLENLILERVARTFEDDPSPRVWSVSGTLTEFRGENYLLMTRAVLKPRALPATRSPEKDRSPADESEPKEKSASAAH